MADQEQESKGASTSSVPRAEVTESHVLGYVILRGLPAWRELERAAGDDVIGLFYNSNHRSIARAILRLVEEERPLSESSLDDQLTAQKATLSGDNRDVIVSLMSSTGIDTRKVFAEAISQLIEKRSMRALQQGLDSLRSRISEDAVSMSEASAEIKMIGVASTTTRKLPTFGEIIDEMEKRETAPWSVPTGIDEFDKALGGGFKPGSNIVIGARPKIGKTTLLNNLCVNALDEGAVVFVASLEMTKPQIYSALISCYGGIDRNITIKYADGRESLKNISSEHGSEVADSIEEARQFIYDSDLKIAFPEHISNDNALASIESHIASTVAQYEGRRVVAFIDYLQLMASSSFRLREEVTGITRRLKMLAMELNIPIVYLSQLNRDADGDMPRPSQLRESGSIEQDADAVIMLNRKNHYDQSEPEHIMDVAIELNRMGPQAHFPLYWNGLRSLIDSLDADSDDEDDSEDFE